MTPLISRVLLTAQVDILFLKNVKPRVGRPNIAIHCLEARFLDKRARRLNDEFWAKLSFQSVKQLVLW